MEPLVVPSMDRGMLDIERVPKDDAEDNHNGTDNTMVHSYPLVSKKHETIGPEKIQQLSSLRDGETALYWQLVPCSKGKTCHYSAPCRCIEQSNRAVDRGANVWRLLMRYQNFCYRMRIMTKRYAVTLCILRKVRLILVVGAHRRIDIVVFGRGRLGH